MKTLVHRLAVECRHRGPLGLIQFIALRLVQWRGDVLYECDLRDARADSADQGRTIVTVDRNNVGSEASRHVEDCILTGGNHVYVDALRADAVMLAALDEGQVASYAFIIYASFYKRILGETDATPMICNCHTFPEYRGQGVYPMLLAAACRHLAASGYTRVIITCAPDNLSSVRGIEKAGFRKVKTLRSLILFTRWIASQRETLPVPTR